jgi:hypothetical protein
MGQIVLTYVIESMGWLFRVSHSSYVTRLLSLDGLFMSSSRRSVCADDGTSPATCGCPTSGRCYLAADDVDREEKSEERVGESRKAVGLESALSYPHLAAVANPAAAGPRPAEKISSA